MASTVGEKGQVVIEKPIRDILGIQPGFVAVQSVRDDHVEIRFFPPEHNRSLRGVLAGRIQRTLSQQDWQKACEEAWSHAAAESAG
ncbi:MAG TPA: AbrB/MazE/SpoVT family DNA-binding domain-containing protein [Thermoanaerobaculia bacterium]|jgi:AbrB family looped-hinge helix DNA binding protein|nr:AbrB/MazE/SpoVT family DNA-binding domain-containing protein [Thermoanaerobaculia bacterium]